MSGSNSNPEGVLRMKADVVLGSLLARGGQSRTTTSLTGLARIIRGRWITWIGRFNKKFYSNLQKPRVLLHSLGSTTKILRDLRKKVQNLVYTEEAEIFERGKKNLLSIPRV
jgi:hypothetical protein